MSAPVIDVHSHLFPTAWRDEGNMPEDMFSPNQLIEEQGHAGVHVSLISDPHIWYGDIDTNEIDRCRQYNDFVAEVARDNPERLAGLGTSVPWRGEEHLAEAERAIRELGLAGLAIATSDRGQLLDAIPDAFFALAEDLGAPIFIHPGGHVIGQEHMEPYRLGEICGRPLDMTITLARLIMTGTLERHPRLRLLCAHAGGAICMIAPRLDFGHELRGYKALGPWGPHELQEGPSHHVARLYLDTVTYGVAPLRLALATVGPDRLLFGSDHPPVPFPLARSIGIVGALGLGQEDLDKVLGVNAAELFGLRTGPES
ncbi:MAG: amidohydrolase family protein [Acidimicrobiales bacterium]